MNMYRHVNFLTAWVSFHVKYIKLLAAQNINFWKEVKK